MENTKYVLRAGCLANWIAVLLSYSINKSICWAMMHWIFGWFYIAYWLFSYTDFSAWVNQMVVYG